MTWLFNNKEFDETLISDYYGFVYLITNLKTGKLYVGRKYFWSVRKVKGKKRRQKLESDWKTYYGSCKPLLEDIKTIGQDSFKREILSLHESKGQVNFSETKLQFQLNVLETLDKSGNKLYYNDNILSRYFTPKRVFDEKRSLLIEELLRYEKPRD